MNAISAEAYVKQQTELFKKWKNTEKHQNHIFNCDGIVNPEVWFSEVTTNKKILFLLKEAYHSDDTKYMEKFGLEYSLVNDLKENAIQSAMWNRVAEWSHGIYEYCNGHTPDFSSLTFAKTKESLNKIAVLNLKKSGGTSISDEENISEYVLEDKALLYQQIMLINPDIIVCGYTFKWFCEIVDFSAGKENTLTTWGYNWNGKIVIDYYHPANQFPALLNFYGLMAVFSRAYSSASGNRNAGLHT